MRVGYSLPLLVIGATITVRIYWFMSSGEITRQGLVFLISLPSVGSRRTKWTSKRETTISNPCGTIGSPALPHPIVCHHHIGPFFQRPPPIHGAARPRVGPPIGLAGLPTRLRPPTYTVPGATLVSGCLWNFRFE